MWRWASIVSLLSERRANMPRSTKQPSGVYSNSVPTSNPSSCLALQYRRRTHLLHRYLMHRQRHLHIPLQRRRRRRHITLHRPRRSHTNYLRLRNLRHNIINRSLHHHHTPHHDQHRHHTTPRRTRHTHQRQRIHGHIIPRRSCRRHHLTLPNKDEMRLGTTKRRLNQCHPSRRLPSTMRRWHCLLTLSPNPHRTSNRQGPQCRLK